MKSLLFLLGGLLGGPAFAGGFIVTGGGELFKDAHNPWFLPNVANVTYCVQSSASSVTASDSTLRASIRSSFAYWKKEFSKSEVGDFKIATQTFVEEPHCTPTTDIRFLFGYENLTPEEIGALGKPEKYIGVAVRTDYDEKNMRGRGFVFISSDRGAHAYENSGHLVNNAWAHEKLLQYVILHELGHIFGLPHGGNGLMAESFLDQILSSSLWQLFDSAPIPSYFQVDTETPVCSINTSFNSAWFELAPNEKCLELFGQPNNFEIRARTDKTALTYRTVATVKFPGPDLRDIKTTPAVVLTLNEQQTVFTPQEAHFRPFMHGPMYVEMGGPANVIFGPGKVKSIYLSRTGSSLVIQGIVGSKIENVLSYTSPLNILLLIKP